MLITDTDETPYEEVPDLTALPAPTSLDEAGLLSWARDHLAGYKLPRSVSFVEEIPRNASGKILKKVLREPFWKDRDRRVG